MIEVCNNKREAPNSKEVMNFLKRKFSDMVMSYYSFTFHLF